MNGKTGKENWPPRFTFTPEGIAAMFLRKHFPDAGEKEVNELAELLRSVSRAAQAENDLP